MALAPEVLLLHRAGGLADEDLVLIAPPVTRRRPPPLRPRRVGTPRAGGELDSGLVMAETSVRKSAKWYPQGQMPDADEDWPEELKEEYTLDRTWRQRVGGFGAVQRAKDRSDGAVVAVKRIFPRNFEKVTRAVKVLREARILAHLTRHADGHVVPLRELFVPRNRNDCWFVMDFVDSDLQSLLPPRTECLGSLEQACYVMKRLLLALKAAHACGVIHRDLKPQNVLVNTELENNVVMLCDFGFARQVPVDHDMTQFGTSHAYWAPEMMMQDAGYTHHVFAHGVHAHYSTKVDQWAAGCIFAEMLGWGGPMFQPTGHAGDFWDYGYRHDTLAAQLGHVDTMHSVVQIMGKPTAQQLDDCRASDAMRTWLSRLPEPDATFESTANGLKTLQGAGLGKDLALDLLRRLITFSPSERLSAEDALKHPLFTEHFKKWQEDEGTPTLKPAPLHDDSAECQCVDDIMRRLRHLAHDVTASFHARRPVGPEPSIDYGQIG
eukprot:Hpha_TRINITY_DN15020_c6_g1::TRINITY_DN15020_c6_g1_i1::g.124580::m.124580/K04371/MAPK1_3; mitogen-activated protein kinase 1/3